MRKKVVDTRLEFGMMVEEARDVAGEATMRCAGSETGTILKANVSNVTGK